jgi:hypothetical protein
MTAPASSNMFAASKAMPSPASFFEALEELREGKTIPIVDEHFDQPPV